MKLLLLALTMSSCSYANSQDADYVLPISKGHAISSRDAPDPEEDYAPNVEVYDGISVDLDIGPCVFDANSMLHDVELDRYVPPAHAVQVQAIQILQEATKVEDALDFAICNEYARSAFDLSVCETKYRVSSTVLTASSLSRKQEIINHIERNNASP